MADIRFPQDTVDTTPASGDRILFADISDSNNPKDCAMSELPTPTATITALALKEDLANKDTTMTGNTASNTIYLSAKAIYDWATGLFATISQVNAKQDILVSGTNLKTVDGNTLLGSGDVVISAAANIPVKDEGTQITATVSSFDFVGAGVTATNVGNAVTVTIAGGGGSGDMILANPQINSGLKTFLDGTFGLRNIANTFTSVFQNAATAARTWTLPNASGTVALTSDITGTNSGTNTGDNSANTNSGLVHTTGTETISGAKTFSSTTIVNAALKSTVQTLIYGGFDRMNWNQYDAGSAARRAYMSVYDQAGNWLGNPIEVDNFPVGEGTREIRLTYDIIKINGTELGAYIQNKFTTINSQTGTTYTFVLADAWSMVTFNNAAAQTITVPPNSSVAFPIGTQIDCSQLGSGKVTFAQGAGVTIQSKGSNKSISAQYVGSTLKKIGTDTWLLFGDLIA